MTDLRAGVSDVECSLPEQMTLPQRRQERAAETYGRGAMRGRRFASSAGPVSRPEGQEGGRDTRPSGRKLEDAA